MEGEGVDVVAGDAENDGYVSFCSDWAGDGTWTEDKGEDVGILLVVAGDS